MATAFRPQPGDTVVILTGGYPLEGCLAKYVKHYSGLFFQATIIDECDEFSDDGEAGWVQGQTVSMMDGTVRRATAEDYGLTREKRIGRKVTPTKAKGKTAPVPKPPKLEAWGKKLC